MCLLEVVVFTRLAKAMKPNFVSFKRKKFIVVCYYAKWPAPLDPSFPFNRKSMVITKVVGGGVRKAPVVGNHNYVEERRQN